MSGPCLSADAAWMQTMRTIKSPAPRDPAAYEQADSVVKCLDRLYRQRRIDLAHVRILRIYGERQMAPSATAPAERQDHRLWREAMDLLDQPLQMRGLVLRRAA